ncbi:hypothetical protein ABPG72_006761 [Tetrahymena utriculariae]
MNYLKAIIITSLIIHISAFENDLIPQKYNNPQKLGKKITHTFNYHQGHIKYSPFRITSDFSRLEKYLEEVQIKQIQQEFNRSKEYFSQVLFIEQSQDRIRFPASQKCGSIDIDFRDADVGIENSDLHIYFDLDNQTLAQACAFSHKNGRPVFGYFLIKKQDYFQEIQLKFIRYMKQLLLLSEQLYPMFVDKSKKQYQKDVYSTKIFIQDKTLTLLKFPNLKNAAQKYFECDLIEGMIVNYDNNEKTLNWIQIIDDLNIQNNQSSQNLFNIFDMSLILDSGWYHIKNDQLGKLKNQDGVDCSIFKKYKIDKIYKNIMQISNLKCHSSCKTCFGQSEQECLSCKNNGRLLNYQCINICTENQEWDYEISQCKYFMSESKTMYCNYCISGQFCFKGQCLDSCEDGFSTKVVENNVVCQKCQQNCLSCISHDLCLKCQSQFKLQDGKCVDECESGYYSNSQSYCQTCHPSCSSCVGNRSDQCSSCPPLQILKQGECHQIQKNSSLYNFWQNQTSLKDEFLESNQKQIAKAIIEYVLEEEDHILLYIEAIQVMGKEEHMNTKIKKHVVKDYIQKLYLGNICDKCGLGYEEKNGVCQKKSEKNSNIQNEFFLKCHDSCQTCSGPLSNDCLTCNLDSNLEEGNCIYKIYKNINENFEEPEKK